MNFILETTSSNRVPTPPTTSRRMSQCVDDCDEFNETVYDLDDEHKQQQNNYPMVLSNGIVKPSAPNIG